jgi:acyl CoA:acetate/3-ketoacid CoA transferase beta subunit
MAVAAAKTLDDGKSVLVGTGLPIIAAALAQRTHAPNLLIVFEAGGIGPKVPTLPLSVGDSRTFHRAIMASSMDYALCIAQMGYIHYGFIGAAQIDCYGNINTTVIGNYDRPKIRFPGSGGANDVGSLCWKTIVLMQQDRQKFVEKLDFLTTPGYLSGPGKREEVGLPAGGGPLRVITQLGVMGFDDETKRMKLLSVHPGVSVEAVKENTGFDLLVRSKLETSPDPTERELRILRSLDPAGIVIR